MKLYMDNIKKDISYLHIIGIHLFRRNTNGFLFEN
jgi:hypothetical protein